MATVLVADDEKNILQLARMYLQAEGFTVRRPATVAKRSKKYAWPSPTCWCST